MKRSAWRLVAGAIFLLLGSLILLNALLSGPSIGGTGGFGLFLAGLIPILMGIGLAASGISGRRSAERGARETSGVDLLKSEIQWRALAQGGQITAAEVASEAGHALADVERALIAMVADGHARAEPDDSGGIVYRVQAPEGST